MWEGGSLTVKQGVRTITKQDNEIRISSLGGSWSDKRSKEFLFPAKPTVADISQQMVGDCFFLSSLASILHTKPDAYIIYDMIREDAFGWVTVRFYDPDTDYSEFYVKFKKTVPWCLGRGFLYNKGPLWVAMLEKAWAIAHYKVSYEASLNGGQPMKVMGMIRGRNGTDRHVYTGKGTDDLRTLFSLGRNTEHYKRVNGADPALKARSMLVHNKWRDVVFNTSQAYFDRWIDFNHDAHLLPALDAYLKSNDGVINLPGARMEDDDIPLRRQMVRIDKFSQWMGKHLNGLEYPIQTCILNYARKIFPGKRGTGSYSEGDIATFTYVRNGLTANEFLTAGTYRTVGATASRIKGTVGEAVSKGLAGPHMYTVLAVAEDHAPPCRHWIKVRNPWGRTVRAYVQDGAGPKLSAVELNPSPTQKNVVARQEYVKPEAETQSVISLAQQGIFWVELSDFVKRFNNIQGGR